jgi:hypothetical protein
VLNDRNDGSLWMYAVAGVHPVAGHYDGTLESPDVFTLEAHFHDYDTDERVRAAVQRLRVRYVLIGRGYVREYNRRATGLRDLGGADFLTKVYENEDAVVYRLVAPESATP